MNKHDQSWKDFVLRQRKDYYFSEPDSARKTVDAILGVVGVVGLLIAVAGLLFGWWD